jgi:hypothetical protein
MNFLGGDWSCSSSVDDALVVTNWDKCTAIVKHAPILLDKSSEFCAILGHEMRQIKFGLEPVAMCGLRELIIKHVILFIESRRVKVLLGQDDPTINVM